jgi:hypothetical protein
MPLMPWQRYVVDVAHEVDPETGFWVYDEVVVTVPRQAGKTTLKIPIYVHRLGRIRMGELWMTAQSGGKAVDRWDKARLWMESAGSGIAHRIKSKVSNDHEVITWLDTLAKLRPFTPNATELHGESPDLVDIDEWWAFDQKQARELEQAYSPGFLTKNAQAWKTSTAGTSASWGLNRDVLRGRQAVELGRRAGLAYFEWSLPDEVAGVPIEELTDDELISACIGIHPAIGFHPTAPAPKMRQHIRTKEWELLGRDGFLRAYGNRMAELGRLSIIPQASWAAAVDRPIPQGAPVGLGFAIDPEHGDAAIAAAFRNLESGEVTAEVLRYRIGTAWLVPEFVAIAGRSEHVECAANAIGHTLEAVDELEARSDWPEEFKVLRMTAQQHGAACARLVKEATTTPRPTFHHIAQAELTLSVENAGKRRVGTGGAWAWLGVETSVAPIDACTAALWAADHPRPVKPNRKFWVK